MFKKYTNLLVRDTNLIAKLLNLIINTKLFCLILTKKMVIEMVIENEIYRARRKMLSPVLRL